MSSIQQPPSSIAMPGPSRPMLIARKSCLRAASRPPSRAGSASPACSACSSDSTKKSVSFCANDVDRVFIADDWDRTPADPAPKLSYHDILEMKQITNSLPMADQLPDPFTTKQPRRFLKTVPIGLLPLLPDESCSTVTVPPPCETIAAAQPLASTSSSSSSSSSSMTTSTTAPTSCSAPSISSPSPSILSNLSRWQNNYPVRTAPLMPFLPVAAPSPKPAVSSSSSCTAPTVSAPSPSSSPAPPARTSSPLFKPHAHSKWQNNYPVRSNGNNNTPPARKFAFLTLIDNTTTEPEQEEEEQPKTFAEFEKQLEEELAAIDAAKKQPQQTGEPQRAPSSPAKTHTEPSYFDIPKRTPTPPRSAPLPSSSPRSPSSRPPLGPPLFEPESPVLRPSSLLSSSPSPPSSLPPTAASSLPCAAPNAHAHLDAWHAMLPPEKLRLMALPSPGLTPPSPFSLATPRDEVALGNSSSSRLATSSSLRTMERSESMTSEDTDSDLLGTPSLTHSPLPSEGEEEYGYEHYYSRHGGSTSSSVAPTPDEELSPPTPSKKEAGPQFCVPAAGGVRARAFPGLMIVPLSE